MRTIISLMIAISMIAPVVIFIMVACSTPPRGVSKVRNLAIAAAIIVASMPITYLLIQWHNSIRMY